MVVKVYGSFRAACPQRVLTCLLEKDVEFEVIHVDLDQGEQKKPEFLMKQPFGQVPAIEDQAFWQDYKFIVSILHIRRAIFKRILAVITTSIKQMVHFIKSRAIIRYYAAKFANRGANLLGSTLEEQAVVDQWLEEVEAHNFNDLVYNIVLQQVILLRMGQREDLVLVNVYEQRLSKSSYLTGENFMLADLSHLPAIRYLMNEAGMVHLIKHKKKINAWWEKISSRPAWKKLISLAGYQECLFIFIVIVIGKGKMVCGFVCDLLPRFSSQFSVGKLIYI